MTFVVIFHNIATDTQGRMLGMMDGYTPGHPLVPVASYRITGTPADADLLEDAYECFNVGDERGDDRAITYRADGNRSLSVGDVVQIGDRFYSCERLGWKPIETPAWFAHDVVRHGTRSLPSPIG